MSVRIFFGINKIHFKQTFFYRIYCQKVFWHYFDVWIEEMIDFKVMNSWIQWQKNFEYQ